MAKNSTKILIKFNEAYEAFLQSLSQVEDCKLTRGETKELKCKLSETIINTEITLDHVSR